MRKPVGNIKSAWKATLKRAGISRRIRPYDLRHAFATQLIAGGADIGTVAELMGHSSPAMLFKTYQHVLTQQKKRAVEALPPLLPCAKGYVPKENGLQ
ncbi:MAG: tyrosine-type recombinase/integrase [Desulfovibrionaceae bacterium]|nr:tyrosine-type recombinase/integrase [Desulfovibrionaceae bacterium]